jgi:pyruvate formate-lyase/glycerol dehydratase family glycyl radical enzyme
MTERIEKLREESLNAVERLSAERAFLVTQFYKSNLAKKCSVPVLRAETFSHLMQHKQLYIGKNELIVGERGPAPKATPTYPEVCLHSMEDLEILNSRSKVSFKIDKKTRNLYDSEIIPFWRDRTIRDRIFKTMEKTWLDAYQAGVFTEFQEQRAPGHTVCGNKIYRLGFNDLIRQIRSVRKNLDYFNDPFILEKVEELKAMEIAAHALIKYAQRHAVALKELAGNEKNAPRKKELLEMAKICERVPAQVPTTFHEALQYYWFVHLGVITELNPWDSFNPGRLDQHLYPFYRAGLEDGTLTEEKARELLQAFWIKFNDHPAPPKIGVTAKESNTYTDFCLINVGGVQADGSDATNDLSYLILDVVEEMRLLQPSSMIQISKKNPDRLLKRAIQIIKTGFGQPSLFNTDAIVQELVRQGKSFEDARNGGASGCVEAGAFGTESYILTGYFNLTKILEITLHNGIDPRSGKKIGINSGDSTHFDSFDKLMNAFEKQLKYFADIKIKGNNIIEQIYARYMPAPFLSLLIDDCVQNAIDYNCGGARYNTSYIQGVGLGSITDSLTSIRYNVFDQKSTTMQTLLDALQVDFQNHTELRHQLINHTPKYGNNDDYADDQAVRIFDIFHDAINGRPTPRGGVFRINLLPTTSHVYFGSVTGAMPDGRKAGEPLSEGISPVQGADRNGPTAVLNSAAKIDHVRTGGTLLNQKFSPQFFQDEESIDKLVHLIRGYFRMDGHHVQFNVISAATLRDAQKHPEKYRDLIVRVAGYSDYFNDLSEELQNEIIRRTEQMAIQ